MLHDSVTPVTPPPQQSKSSQSELYFTSLSSLSSSIPALSLQHLILKLLEQIAKWFKCVTTYGFVFKRRNLQSTVASEQDEVDGNIRDVIENRHENAILSLHTENPVFLYAALFLI